MLCAKHGSRHIGYVGGDAGKQDCTTPDHGIHYLEKSRGQKSDFKWGFAIWVALFTWAYSSSYRDRDEDGFFLVNIPTTNPGNRILIAVSSSLDTSTPLSTILIKGFSQHNINQASTSLTYEVSNHTHLSVKSYSAESHSPQTKLSAARV